MVSRVRAIAESNIGVMGHIGLTPQSATKLGGFRAQGRTADAALELYDDALALAGGGLLRDRARGRAGAGRGADHRGARRSRRSGSAPAPACDGQVLVWHDLLGLYAGPHAAVRQAVRGDRRRDRRARSTHYVADVRSGAFPEEQHTYSIPDDELERVRGGAGRARLRRRANAAASGSGDASAAAPARPSVQPWTVRTPITSRPTDQSERTRASSDLEDAAPPCPRRRRRGGRARRRRARASPARARARARSGTAANASRCRGAAVRALRAERATRRRSSAPPNSAVGEPAVQPAGEERPDRDEQPVVVVVVHQVPGRRASRARTPSPRARRSASTGSARLAAASASRRGARRTRRAAR